MSTPPPLQPASNWDVPSLGLVLGATVLNAIIFLALTSSYAAAAR